LKDFVRRCRFQFAIEVWIYFLSLEFWPGAEIGTISQVLVDRCQPQDVVVSLTTLSLKKGTNGKPKIPLDTLPILGYFPVIVTHHSF
jgi:hypothetical protein